MSVISSGRFAAATSVLALVVAMGGTGYATVKIKGNQIAKNAVTSKTVKNDSLTGKDIKESTLGQVGSAANAASAATAAKVNGVTPSKFLYRSSSSTPVVVFSGSGLSITALCVVGYITLHANTSKDNSQFYTQVYDLEANAFLEADLENGQFDVATTADVMAGANVAQEDPALVTFEYDAPDGAVVTGKLATDNNQTPSVCSVTGMLLVG